MTALYLSAEQRPGASAYPYQSGSHTKDGCPTSRSFFARCGIPLLFPSDP